MAAFVPQELLAPRQRAAFHLQHLVQLQCLQTRMREIERNRDRRHTLRRKPLIAEIADRTEIQTASRKLLIELSDPGFELASLDIHAQVADPPFEQLVIFDSYPG